MCSLLDTTFYLRGDRVLTNRITYSLKPFALNHPAALLLAFGEMPLAVFPSSEADLRKSHTFLSFPDAKWRHNCDFAVLKVGEDPNAGMRNAYELPPGLLFNNLCPGIQVEQNDEAFVFGVPAKVTKAELKLRQPRIKYSDFISIFQPYVLHVSYGKVVHTHNTMCSYNANTAGGMSGGPVYALKGTSLQLVGLHVGGYPLPEGSTELGLNQFVPLAMAELQDMLSKIDGK